ncbi:MAG TPA: hypothetical protein DDW50_01515 [Firmicutes bacterium]|nr:hypothetical protein [Bacillota bacterium]
MKKLISLMMTGCMLLGVAVAVQAENKVSLDVVGGSNFNLTDKFTAYFSDGTVDGPNKTKYVGDLSGLLLGFETSLDKFKLGAEYGLWSTDEYSSKENGVKDPDDNYSEDLVVAEVKGGYRVVDQNRFKLDLTMGVLDLSYKETVKENGSSSKSKNNISGNMIGVDGTVNFSDKASLQGTVAYSLVGAYVMGLDDPSLTEIKLKYNYALTDNWGLGLGYRAYLLSGKYDGPGSDVDITREKDKVDGNIGAFTLGASYKF